MSGRLLIRNWRHCQDLIDETILEPGDYHAVKLDICINLRFLRMVLDLKSTGQNSITMILKESTLDLIEKIYLMGEDDSSI